MGALGLEVWVLVGMKSDVQNVLPVPSWSAGVDLAW